MQMMGPTDLLANAGGIDFDKLPDVFTTMVYDHDVLKFWPHRNVRAEEAVKRITRFLSSNGFTVETNYDHETQCTRIKASRQKNPVDTTSAPAE